MIKVAWLVSGWGGPGIEWRFSPIVRALVEDGWEVIRFKQCNNGWGDINHLAQKLSYEMSNVVADVRTIVAHSMGGLIALEADRMGNEDRRVIPDHIISLGTPFGGSRVAKLAPWSESAQQMTPGSEYLYSAKWYVPNAEHMVVGGRRDFIVNVDSATRTHADRTLVTNDTHLSMLFNKGVAEEVIDFLN